MGCTPGRHREDTKKIQQIAALKQKIPNVKCKGFCFRSCSIIGLTQLEHRLIEQRHGVHLLQTPAGLAIKKGIDTPCAALKDRRCTIWQDKETYPTICFGFGAVEHMKCPFGCVPEGGEWMSIEEFKLLQCDIDEIGGLDVMTGTPMGIRVLRQQLSTRTGIRKYREFVLSEMAQADAWWANYVKTNPDNLPLEGL